MASRSHSKSKESWASDSLPSFASGDDREGSEISGDSYSSFASVHHVKEGRIGFDYWITDGELMKSSGFNIFVNLAIVGNAIVIGLETDYSCHSTVNCKPEDFVLWQIFEYLFLFIFTLEIALKIIAYKWKGFWEENWNKFDFLLVGSAMMDVLVMGALLGTSKQGGGGLKIFSVLRVLRAFRLVRLVKLLRQFKELYLLVNGMMEACKTLAWVACLLLVILYVIGIIFTILIGQNTDPALTYTGTWTKQDYWGSVPRSMFTLFQITTGDSWGSRIARPIIREYPLYTIFFLAFIFLISFGLMNIVFGVICENAIYAASKNVENMQRIVVKHQQMVINSISAIFEAADTDGSGELSKEEFDDALNKKSVKQKLELIDVPSDDLRMLFGLLDADGSGEITIEEFRKGCLKLQGTAKSREMIKLAVHVSTYNRNLDDMQDAMEEQNRTLKNIYHRLYDLEKQYFRQDSQKKSKALLPSDDDTHMPQSKKGNGLVSIFGAVAAAGRHSASKRGSHAELPGEVARGARRGSFTALSNFVKRNTLTSSAN